MNIDSGNTGGRTTILNHLTNHQIAVANAKPTINTRAPVPQHVDSKLKGKDRAARKIKPFEFHEVM